MKEQKNVIIAIPKNKKLVKVIDEKAFGTNIFSKFYLNTILIGGADATENNIGLYPVEYNVYIYSPATALGENTYTVILEDV